MAIDKKLIHFKTWNTFISQGVGSETNITTPTSGSEETHDAIYGQIRGTSIVFIKDVGKIWTHGRFYGENNESSGIQFERVYWSVNEDLTEEQLTNNIRVFERLCEEDKLFKVLLDETSVEVFPQTINHNDDGSISNIELLVKELFASSNESNKYSNLLFELKPDGTTVYKESYQTEFFTTTKINELLDVKQDTLVSGTNISTINGQSLLTGEDIQLSLDADAELRLLKEGSTDEDKEYNLKTLELVQQGKAVAYRSLDGETVTYQYSGDRKFSSVIFSEDYMTTFNSFIELADDGHITSQASLVEGAFVLTTAVEFKVWLGWKAKAEPVGTYRNLYVLEDSTRCWVDAYEFNETTTVFEYNCNNKRYKRTYTNETGDFVKEELELSSNVTIDVDSALSSTSENPVQNKVITQVITDIENRLSELTNYDDTIKKSVQDLQTALDSLINGGTTEAIDSINEILAFLSTIADTETLAGMFANLQELVTPLYINIGINFPQATTSGTFSELNVTPTEVFEAAQNKKAIWIVDSLGTAYQCTVAITKEGDSNGVTIKAFTHTSDGSLATIAIMFVENSSVAIWRSSYTAVQEKLESGTNIKTINGDSILGEGDILLSASPEIYIGTEEPTDENILVWYDTDENGESTSIDSEVSETSTNAIENQAITKYVNEQIVALETRLKEYVDQKINEAITAVLNTEV